jgi:hypothetical protein
MDDLVITRTVDLETPNGVSNTENIDLLEKACFYIAKW